MLIAFNYIICLGNQIMMSEIKKSFHIVLWKSEIILLGLLAREITVLESGQNVLSELFYFFILWV